MWKPGDVISWRGIYRERIWHVQPTILVRDCLEEIALTLLPGTECIAEETYPKGKKGDSRRWHFMDHDWTLAKYTWQRNRLLLLFEPQKYYSIILFWNHTSHDFLCYYINFQLPFKRNTSAVDTLDLDLDLIIRPDFSFEWKDVEDYQNAISHGLILPEWSKEIESATDEVMKRLEKRKYPFDDSWRDWMPDPSWQPPKLPQNWDVL